MDKYGYRIVNLLNFFQWWKGVYGTRPELKKPELDYLLEHIEHTHALCKELGLESAKVRAQFLIATLRDPGPHVATSPSWRGAHYHAQLLELEKHLENDLDGICFEPIPKDRLQYYDTTFGSEVDKAFSSARYDVREANICYALGRSTACVFHCMRAAEIALRALCRDRALQFPKGGGIAKQEWGVLVKALDSENTRLVNLPATTWASSEVRDAQLAFYAEAVSIFRGLNEQWRKRVSHSKGDYDDIQAGSIRLRTEEFLGFLAPRISERKKPTGIWKR